MLELQLDAVLVEPKTTKVFPTLAGGGNSSREDFCAVEEGYLLSGISLNGEYAWEVLTASQGEILLYPLRSSKKGGLSGTRPLYRKMFQDMRILGIFNVEMPPGATGLNLVAVWGKKLSQDSSFEIYLLSLPNLDVFYKFESKSRNFEGKLLNVCMFFRKRLYLMITFNTEVEVYTFCDLQKERAEEKRVSTGKNTGKWLPSQEKTIEKVIIRKNIDVPPSSPSLPSSSSTRKSTQHEKSPFFSDFPPPSSSSRKPSKQEKFPFLSDVFSTPPSSFKFICIFKAFASDQLIHTISLPLESGTASSQSESISSSRKKFSVFQKPAKSASSRRSYIASSCCSDSRFYICQVDEARRSRIVYLLPQTASYSDRRVCASSAHTTSFNDVYEEEVIEVRFGRFGPNQLTYSGEDGSLLKEEVSPSTFEVLWMKAFGSGLEDGELEAEMQQEGLWCVGEAVQNFVLGRVESVSSIVDFGNGDSLVTFSSLKLCLNGYLVGAEVLSKSGALVLSWNMLSNSEGPYLHIFEKHTLLGKSLGSSKQLEFLRLSDLMPQVPGSRLPSRVFTEKNREIESLYSFAAADRCYHEACLPDSSPKLSRSHLKRAANDLLLRFIPNSFITNGKMSGVSPDISHFSAEQESPRKQSGLGRSLNSLLADNPSDWASAYSFSAVAMASFSPQDLTVCTEEEEEDCRIRHGEGWEATHRYAAQREISHTRRRVVDAEWSEEGGVLGGELSRDALLEQWRSDSPLGELRGNMYGNYNDALLSNPSYHQRPLRLPTDDCNAEITGKRGVLNIRSYLHSEERRTLPGDVEGGAEDDALEDSYDTSFGLLSKRNIVDSLKKKKSLFPSTLLLDSDSHYLCIMKIEMTSIRKLIMRALRSRFREICRIPSIVLLPLQEVGLLPKSCKLSRENIDFSFLKQQQFLLDDYTTFCCFLDLFVNNLMSSAICDALTAVEGEAENSEDLTIRFAMPHKFVEFVALWATTRLHTVLPQEGLLILGDYERICSDEAFEQIEDALIWHGTLIKALKKVFNSIIQRMLTVFDDGVSLRHSNYEGGRDRPVASKLLCAAIEEYSYCSALLEWSRIKEILKTPILIDEDYPSTGSGGLEAPIKFERDFRSFEDSDLFESVESRQNLPSSKTAQYTLLSLLKDGAHTHTPASPSCIASILGHCSLVKQLFLRRYLKGSQPQLGKAVDISCYSSHQLLDIFIELLPQETSEMKQRIRDFIGCEDLFMMDVLRESFEPETYKKVLSLIQPIQAHNTQDKGHKDDKKKELSPSSRDLDLQYKFIVIATLTAFYEKTASSIKRQVLNESSVLLSANTHTRDWQLGSAFVDGYFILLYFIEVLVVLTGKFDFLIGANKAFALIAGYHDRQIIQRAKMYAYMDVLMLFPCQEMKFLDISILQPEQDHFMCVSVLQSRIPFQHFSKLFHNPLLHLEEDEKGEGMNFEDHGFQESFLMNQLDRTMLSYFKRIPLRWFVLESLLTQLESQPQALPRSVKIKALMLMISMKLSADEQYALELHTVLNPQNLQNDGISEILAKTDVRETVVSLSGRFPERSILFELLRMFENVDFVRESSVALDYKEAKEEDKYRLLARTLCVPLMLIAYLESDSLSGYIAQLWNDKTSAISGKDGFLHQNEEYLSQCMAFWLITTNRPQILTSPPLSDIFLRKKSILNALLTFLLVKNSVLQTYFTSNPQPAIEASGRKKALSSQRKLECLSRVAETVITLLCYPMSNTQPEPGKAAKVLACYKHLFANSDEYKSLKYGILEAAWKFQDVVTSEAEIKLLNSLRAESSL